MKRIEQFNRFGFFGQNFKLDLKTIFESDIARLTFMVLVMSIGLYIIQGLGVFY